MRWRPSLGAWSEDGRIRFRVWAPEATTVEAVAWEPGRAFSSIGLEKFEDGTFRGESPEIVPGDLYGYRVDGEGPFPDPASRYQPAGVHGPSQVVDVRSVRMVGRGVARNPATTSWSSMSFTSVPSQPRGRSPRHLDGCPTWPGWGSPRSSSCPSPIFPAVGTGV